MQKHILLLLGILFMSLNSFAQVYAANGSACDLYLNVHYTSVPNCNNQINQAYISNAGSAFTIPAIPGYEISFIEVHNWPLCSNGLGIAVAPPPVFQGNACTQCSSFGIPSQTAGSTNGCNSCQPVVNAWFTTCNVVRFW